MLAVKLNANRSVTGNLRGFDQFMNIVLDNTAEVDASVDLGPGSRRTTRTEDTKFQQNIAVFQCMLGSLRASCGCLNGHPSAPKVVPCDVTTRSFPIFLKRTAWD